MLLAPCAPAQTEPTPEETAVLCWVNRFRSDPQSFARLVLAADKPEDTEHVDWQMFADELAALRPAPPLFFEPRLIDAARAHARYMVEAKEYGHHETEGRPGFTGASPGDRARAAGYPSPVAECAWARGTTPFGIVAGYVLDVGPPGSGSGGMQEGRGHRRCMIDARHREAGVGLFAWGASQLSNVKLYGQAPGVGRVLGGVAIEDRDSDAFYDVGEGLGGVHIAVGDRCTMSTSSGAWRIDLPAGDRTKKLLARRGSLRLEREIAAGTENLAIDLLFALAREAADLEAKLAKTPDTAAPQQRALRLRLLELRAPSTPAETQLGDEVTTLETTLLDALGTRPSAEVNGAFQAARRSFAGTVVEEWLRQAQLVDTLMRTAATARTVKSATARAKQLRACAVDIDRRLLEITHPELWRRLASLRRELDAQ